MTVTCLEVTTEPGEQRRWESQGRGARGQRAKDLGQTKPQVTPTSKGGKEDEEPEQGKKTSQSRGELDQGGAWKRTEDKILRGKKLTVPEAAERPKGNKN